MQKSNLVATEAPLEVQSKSHLLRVVNAMLPKWRNLRVLTNKEDQRSNGNDVAICEQDQNGKLTVLVGAPTLSLAANFFKNAVLDGRIK